MKETIQGEVEANQVVLYMKGSKHFPQCGFSAKVVQILSELGVDYLDKNVLLDDELRQSIKEYSNWPTIPQLYVGGKFIGGCDIVTEMHESGDLEKLLG